MGNSICEDHARDPRPDFPPRQGEGRGTSHPLRQFVTEAVAEKLAGATPARAAARMKLAGKLAHLRRETARINARIESEFETIEPEDQV